MRLIRFLCTRKLPIEYSNFPQRYIERAKEQIEYKTPRNDKRYQDRVLKREVFTYGMHRPWTDQFYEENKPGKLIPPDLVEPLKYWTIYRGDLVEIMKGKDKGKQGIVNYIVVERNWVTVEGLNCDYKYVGGKGLPRVMVKEEQPLLVTTEVALVDPGDNKPTQVEWRYTDDGDEVRVSLRSGRIIPLPTSAHETYDYKTKKMYPEQPKDTVAKEVQKITFQPRLCTFEQDIMKEMGITEDRIPAKTYWY